METFQYKARDKFGKLITGMMDGESSAAIVARLKEMNYVPLSIKKAKKAGGGGIFSGWGRINATDVNMFLRQFAALQKAGIPILLSLRSLSQEIGNKRLKDAINQIVKSIESGESLSSAFEKHPTVFSQLQINLMQAGEASGTLAQSLERLAVLGDYEEQLRLRIQSATRYPLIVIVAVVIGFLILSTAVIPRFAQIYGQANVALPIPTQILLWVNFMMKNYWWVFIAVLGVASFSFVKFINTKNGRVWWDNFKLNVPIFGPMILKLSMSRFTRTTGLLMRSGVSLFKILELASGSTGNVIISRTIDSIKASVSEGKGISEPMKLSGMFTPTVVQVVTIGEQTGKLDELLLHVADYYDSQVDFMVKNITSLIEPILIFILGGMVLVMALGIFLPMWNLMSLFKR
ncbi:type II secretion system F family protein [Candidatus Omnitrophota bacterium]